MRQTLLFGGLESVEHNINRRSADLAFYEFGNVYSLDPAKESTTDAPLAPYAEGARLGMWLTGATRSGNWLRCREEATVFDLKAAVAGVLARCGVEASFKAAEQSEGGIFDHALVVVSSKGQTIGRAGIVSAAICRRCGIKVPVFFAELDWDAVARISSRHNVLYAPLPKTQPVKRDLSLLIGAEVAMADIEAAVRDAERRLLRSVELFDVYEGDKLPAGKKSYAISITLQDDEKTLQDKHIDKIMAKVVDTLRARFNAELR
jgi:phenylalanyl-tRNA synthetase beta chain